MSILRECSILESWITIGQLWPVITKVPIEKLLNKEVMMMIETNLISAYDKSEVEATEQTFLIRWGDFL